MVRELDMVGEITFNYDFSSEIPVFGGMGLLFVFWSFLLVGFFVSSCINSGDRSGRVYFFL